VLADTGPQSDEAAMIKDRQSNLKLLIFPPQIIKHQKVHARF